MNHPASLYELTLAEQLGRNQAALAAITVRRDDIAELQRLRTALTARGLRVHAQVTTHPLGSAAYVRMHLWASCSVHELGDALEWLTAADIGVERLVTHETGPSCMYRLRLRAMEVDLHAMAYGDLLPAGAKVAKVAA